MQIFDMERKLFIEDGEPDPPAINFSGSITYSSDDVTIKVRQLSDGTQVVVEPTEEGETTLGHHGRAWIFDMKHMAGIQYLT